MAEPLPDERKIDPKAQCPDGVLHHFKEVRGKPGEQHCIKCNLTKEYINNLLEEASKKIVQDFEATLRY